MITSFTHWPVFSTYSVARDSADLYHWSICNISESQHKVKWVSWCELSWWVHKTLTNSKHTRVCELLTWRAKPIVMLWAGTLPWAAAASCPGLATWWPVRSWVCCREGGNLQSGGRDPGTAVCGGLLVSGVWGYHKVQNVSATGTYRGAAAGWALGYTIGE